MPAWFAVVLILAAVVLIPFFGYLLQQEGTPELRGCGNSYLVVGATITLVATPFCFVNSTSDTGNVWFYIGVGLVVLGGAIRLLSTKLPRSR